MIFGRWIRRKCHKCQLHCIDMRIGKMRQINRYAWHAFTYWMWRCECGQFRVDIHGAAKVYGDLPEKIKPLSDKAVSRYLRRYIPKFDRACCTQTS